MAGMFLTGNAASRAFASATIIVVARRDPRLAHGPAGAARRARRHGRRGRVPFLARRRAQRRVPGLERDPRPRPAASRCLARARGGRLLALPRPAISMHTLNPGAAGAAAARCRSCGPTTASGRVPGRPAARDRRGARPRHRRRRRSRPAIAVAARPRARRRRAVRTRRVRRRPRPHGTVAIVSLPRGQRHRHVSRRALATLRDDVIPATIGRVPARDSTSAGRPPSRATSTT